MQGVISPKIQTLYTDRLALVHVHTEVHAGCGADPTHAHGPELV